MVKYCIISYEDYCKSWFKDVLEHNDVVFMDEFLNRNSIALKLHRSITRVQNHFDFLGVPVMIKQALEYHLLQKVLKRRGVQPDDTIVFVFFEWSFAALSLWVQKRLKKVYKNSKSCLMFTNTDKKIIEVGKYLWKFKTVFARILTFDTKMAKKYDLEHVYLPFSVGDLNPSRAYDSSFDVCFCGADKGRAELILDIYNHLSASGIRCDFKVFGARPTGLSDEQVGTVQFSTQKFPHNVVVASILNSNCILEVVDNNNPLYQTSYTMRVQEAVAYRKKLLTNCAAVVESPAYNSHQFSVFHDLASIDIDFVLGKDQTGFAEASTFSPREFLKKMGASQDNDEADALDS